MKVARFSLSPYPRPSHTVEPRVSPVGVPPMNPPTVDRRTATKYLGALTALGLTGGGALVFSSEPASADVTADLSIPDGSYRAEEPPATPWLQCDGTYSYHTPDIEPTEVLITLSVGATPDNRDDLATWSTVPFGFDQSGNWQVQGALVDTAIWVADDFKAGDGNTISIEVYATATMEVLDGDAVLVSASATDSGILTIEDTTSLNEASLSGTGGWAFQANSTDPTPTPP